ncbi:MAG TPA: choice-of-anchor I family protein [Nostocaceae cyanobacterium]|nr:choice-of-anchor I family protein [Nostocaceae cyanobacterium]
MPAISLTGTTYIQDFDSLANSGTTSDVLPAGWEFLETGTNANTTYGINNGSSNTGNTYSYGASGSTDRAFGGLQSGSLVPTIGVSFTNNTGSTITSLTISYRGEQWRLGATGRTDRLDFQYSLDATSLSTGTWNNFDSLNFSSVITSGTTGAIDGNAAGNSSNVSGTISGLNIANGATFYLRWQDFNASGADDGLAIDNFSLSIPNTTTAGVTIVQSGGGTNVAEGGATDEYTLVLNSQPTENVVVNITPNAQLQTNLSQLTFTPSNWNQPQNVTVTAVDDANVEGAHSGTIAHTVTSADTNYNGISISPLNVNITDNDTANNSSVFLTRISGFSGTGAEITDYDPTSKRLFVVDGTAFVQIINLSDPSNPTPISAIDLTAYGSAANSVAVKNGIVAIATEAATKTDPGKVVFYDTAGNFLKAVTVGALPDMVTFTPDGTKVLTANEGEPGAVDPEGSISIIDISQGVANATVATASFTSFDGQEATLKSQGVRLFPNKTVSQDVEPEYITFSQDGTKAWVTLQENNSLAVVNIATATVEKIVPLGTVDHNQPGNAIDASDRENGTTGTINIQNWPVLGMFMPDAIASFTANGRTYYVTANEGDARTEEARVSTLNLDPTAFPNATTLKQNANLGRLTVSNIDGDIDGDGDYDKLFAYGTRSFSIWDDQGTLVYNSGDALERITAQQVPTIFNSEGTASSFDGRSDNKGPEPEGVAVGVINGRTYAFIGLERVGGVMVYEVTNPQQPKFIEYVPNPTGDIAPEGLKFIPASDSPNGKNLLVVANEVSKTVSIFQVNPAIRISDIQGTGHSSPLVGQTVNNVAGIVTAVASNGFYIQDPNPDNDDRTSEAIFVFTSSAPTVQIGDAVTVNGKVTEFRPGNNTNNLTLTELTNPTINKISSGNPLPTAVILGNGGRTIPTTVIDNDSNGQVGNGTFDPSEDGIDFYESLEGMRVQINNPVTVSPTNRFGEIWVLADNGANATGRTARGGIGISQGDFNPERIQIDDSLAGATSPNVDVGAQLNTIIGIVDYNFSNYEVLPTTLPTVVTATSLTKEVTNLTSGANQLTVATFNVENLDPSDGATKFNNLASRIVNNLKSPDIISLEEIQDNNGATNDSVVDASQTYQTLINAIASAGGPTYQYRQINPVDDTNGGEPGGNIRVGFLFNPQRVQFSDRPGGTSTSNTTVNNVNGIATLSSSPGLIDPTNSAFDNSRKPLVGEFTFNGQTIYVIANHFNSKGGDQPLFGVNQPPTLNSEVQRNQQATIVKNFVQSILAINPNANVIVAGDLNDFEFSNPLTTLESAGLNTLVETLPQNERYTYNFEGNAQTLDHILVSQNLFNNLDGFDVVHINSEFADQDSDHDPVVARFTITNQNVTNNAPTNLTLSATNINENLPANTVIGAFTTTDPDQGNTFIYSLVDGAGSSDNSAFTINGNNLAINNSPDFETKSSYNIRVRSTDQGRLSFEKEFVIGVNDIPTQLLNSQNDVFQISGESTKVKLKVKLTGRNSSLVNELGAFIVDDQNGTINGIAPGAAGYTQAALARSQVIFSAIANSPTGFDSSNLSRLLEFDSNTNFRFYLFKNSSFDTVIQNSTTSEIIFSSAAFQSITALTSGGFTVGWKDGSNTTSTEFNDLVVNIEATNDAAPLGSGLQGDGQAEVIDLRDVSSSVAVTAQFTINREAGFDNFVGFYQVTDENGGIDTNNDGVSDLLPGQTGYIQAAINQRVAGINLTVSNQATATYTGTFSGGAIFAPFIVVNGRPEALLDTNTSNDPAVYFPYLGANSDQTDHIRLLGDNVFAFEDLPNGGDKDYNDTIVKINLSIG